MVNMPDIKASGGAVKLDFGEGEVDCDGGTNENEDFKVGHGFILLCCKMLQ